jgi:hypothetical protein
MDLLEDPPSLAVYTWILFVSSPDHAFAYAWGWSDVQETGNRSLRLARGHPLPYWEALLNPLLLLPVAGY